MKEYRYHGLAALAAVLTQCVGAAVTIAATAAGGYLVALALFHPGRPTTAAYRGILMMAIGWLLIGLQLINLYPTVWIGDDGLIISAFLGVRIHVKWKDVIDISSRQPLWIFPDRSFVVRARHITVFHRLLGLAYAWSLSPAFLIHRQIEDYDELLDEIRERSTATRGGQTTD